MIPKQQSLRKEPFNNNLTLYSLTLAFSVEKAY
jgi:hypothetical protein